MNKKPEQTMATRRNLKEAYCRLLCERQKITVDSLCRRAGYNRCTFYRYYVDLGQILEEIETELAVQIGAISRERLDAPDLSCFVDGMVALYETNGELVCLLMEQDPSFLQIMRREMAPILLKYCRIDESMDRELVLSFIATALFQTLTEWHRTGKKLPIQQVSLFLLRAFKQGVLV